MGKARWPLTPAYHEAVRLLELILLATLGFTGSCTNRAKDDFPVEVVPWGAEKSGANS